MSKSWQVNMDFLYRGQKRVAEEDGETLLPREFYGRTAVLSQWPRPDRGKEAERRQKLQANSRSPSV